MLRDCRRWLAAVLMILILCTCAAAEVQLDREGSVSVQIHTAEGVNIKNARVEIYRVGDAVIKDHNLCFELSADFVGSGISLDCAVGDVPASDAETYIDAQKLQPHMKTVTDESGTAVFSGVLPGLYLVRQNGFEGKKQYFSEISAFMVSVPMSQDGASEWDYALEAQPKVNALPTPTPTPKPADTPSDPTLPQTGMLRWPIPVLGAGGLAIFALGWVLFFVSRKDRNA